MAHSRIEIKLTKAGFINLAMAGHETRATGHHFDHALYPARARVDDVLAVEISSALEGSVVLRVISPTLDNWAKSETMTEGPKSPEEKRQRKPQSSRSQDPPGLVGGQPGPGLTTLGSFEKAIRLCESEDGNRQRSTLDCGSLNWVERLETSTPGFGSGR